MEENIGIIIVICASVIAGVIMGIGIYTETCISPMDVYQGKTTLEYTIVDGVKADSTVVWKNNK